MADRVAHFHLECQSDTNYSGANFTSGRKLMGGLLAFKIRLPFPHSS